MVHEDVLETAVNTCKSNRRDTVVRIVDMLASQNPGHGRKWDGWFDDILDFALRRARNEEEKEAERTWWESLVARWERIVRRRMSEALLEVRNL